MINTEELTQGDVDRLNSILRAAQVTSKDVNEIAQEMGLGAATVRRWFDATNAGDYSPCIPAAAVGREAYLLHEQDADDPADRSRYSQSPNAYEEEDEIDSDDEEGIGDPTKESLYDRILFASLMAEGFEREANVRSDPPQSRETFTGAAHDYRIKFSSPWQATAYVENIISGGEGRWKGKAWVSFSLDYIDGEWLLTEIDNWMADDDPS